MTEAVDRFNPKRLGRIASGVAKQHFPQDEMLSLAVRSPYWSSAAYHLRKYPVEGQESFFQAFFARRSIRMPNGLRLARFLVTLNNPGQPLNPPDQTDPAQLVSDYFQNIGQPPMKIQIAQESPGVVEEDMREVINATLGSTARQLYNTARAKQHVEALTIVLNLTKEVVSSPIYFGQFGSQRFMIRYIRYAEICGGAVMVQALTTDKQDPSFTLEPLIQLHERGYLIPGPVLTVAEKQPLWRRFLPVRPARESTFMLYRPLRAE